MRTHCLLALMFAAALLPAEGADIPGPFASTTPLPVLRSAGSGKLDDLVFGKLKRLEIEPAQPCTDPVFLRRVYLDVIGTLPTVKESREFLEDKSPLKRSELVSRLLERDEFADYWGMKWCDLLRVKAEFPVNLWPNAAQAYDRWIRASLRENLPYSEFARQLLSANGSNFRDPASNFYRSAGAKDPKAIARAVALTFMGQRAEKWPAQKLENLAVFFSQIGFKATNEWKEEIVYFKGIDSSAPGNEVNPAKSIATLPDGTRVKFPPGKDPRDIFTQWLITSPNSNFAKSAANRIWFWLLGRGIVNEPDDFRPDNPPSNPELLNYLAKEFASHGFDTRHLLRLILNSRTYQLGCVPNTTGPEAEENFAFYPIRRLDAELIIDGFNQITGATDEYSSMIPEPFTWVPTEKRAMALPDGSIGSAFLDMFGRPPRDTGLLGERNNHATAAQRLHLLNSSSIQGKITKSQALRTIINTNPPAKAAEQLYLTILSRYPTGEELAKLKTYSQSAEAKGPQVLYDLAWALFNSAEFLYRH